MTAVVDIITRNQAYSRVIEYTIEEDKNGKRYVDRKSALVTESIGKRMPTARPSIKPNTKSSIKPRTNRRSLSKIT